LFDIQGGVGFSLPKREQYQKGAIAKKAAIAKKVAKAKKGKKKNL
jgi:hypothetical protein